MTLLRSSVRLRLVVCCPQTIWMCHWSPPRHISPTQSHLSLTKQQATEDHVQGALLNGLYPSIHITCFFWVFLFGEKGGCLWSCISFRNLKQITIKYLYPMPLAPPYLVQLHTAKVFNKLQCAYNMVCIRQDDEWKTAFSTISGHLKYCIMPYGFSCAPSVFQHLSNDVLRHMQGKCVIAYTV